MKNFFSLSSAAKSFHTSFCPMDAERANLSSMSLGKRKKKSAFFVALFQDDVLKTLIMSARGPLEFR